MFFTSTLLLAAIAWPKQNAFAADGKDASLLITSLAFSWLLPTAHSAGTRLGCQTTEKIPNRGLLVGSSWASVLRHLGMRSASITGLPGWSLGDGKLWSLTTHSISVVRHLAGNYS